MLNRFQDVFKSLHHHQVKYVVIGGIAAVLYGVPRVTFDVYILIQATPENVAKLLTALEAAGLASASLTSPEQVLAHEITIFKDRVRIDVQTATPGLTFARAWKNRRTISYQEQTIQVISREDLIASKYAAGRAIDIEDARILESIQENPPTPNSEL